MKVISICVTVVMITIILAVTGIKLMKGILTYKSKETEEARSYVTATLEMFYKQMDKWIDRLENC